MTTAQHPVFQTIKNFDELYQGLMECVKEGTVNRQVDPSTGLELFNYNETCSFEHKWNKYSLVARGLILDPVHKFIVAVPFPKFFNFGERECVTFKLDAPFQAYEKMDGSLGIVYFYGGEWRVATRGSMFSPQAQWGKQWLDNHPEITQDLHLDITYLVEIIYKENKVVISYPFEGLVLLGAYDIVSGYEVSYSILRQFSQKHPAIRIADIHEFKSFNDAAEYVKTLPGNREGFVIHFPETGDRLKIKGDEYKTLHKMISSISPLAVWEMLVMKMDIEAYKKQMPEEFWDEIDGYVTQLTEQFNKKWLALVELNLVASTMSDKELGLEQKKPDSPFKNGMLFPLRKRGESTAKQLVWESCRPTGNVINPNV